MQAFAANLIHDRAVLLGQVQFRLPHDNTSAPSFGDHWSVFMFRYFCVAVLAMNTERREIFDERSRRVGA